MRFVPSDELEIGTIIARDIIFTTHAAILRRGTTLTARYIEYLQSKGYMGAYVNDALSADIDIEETIDPVLFQEGVEAVMEENVKDILDVATGIVSDISSKKNICTDLIDLRSYDDYTYHHSVNVAVYAVILGKRLGLADDDLKLIAQAGLLHDLGKSQIPEGILNKPGRLTDEEYKQIQQHARYSFEMLADNYDVSAVVRQAILYHHENENGSGYPYGKEGSEVGMLARILHVVDVYDALTSRRPYKEPYEPVHAFDYMNGGKNILFFSNAVDTLLDVIPAYPAGVDIYLSNGERALVMDHSKNSLRPKVRIVSNGNVVDLDKDPAYRSVTITHSGIMPLNSYQGQVILLNEERSAVKATRKNIMVVDNTPLSRMQVQACLEEEYNVIMQNSTIDAIEYLENKDNIIPDLIIMEIDMPVLDGLTAVKRIRERGHSDIPIIFLTSVNDRDIVIQCKMMGSSDYILKPAKPVYIRERVYAAIYHIDNM